MPDGKKNLLEGAWIALKAAFLATLCCSTPLILAPLFMILGIGSVTAALRIPAYKTYFIALSVAFMLASIYLNVKNRNKGVCNVKTICQDTPE
ncbi:MAG: hypothetical protein NTU61_02220 [Candidatus Altiarchaeota archaeon]|nr:hypothetical protein [Candidatus Altiarchaeota archaeon]